MANERVVNHEATIEVLRQELRRLIRERALLAEAIREIAAAANAIDRSASLTGPELLHVAKEVSRTISSGEEPDDYCGLRPDGTVCYRPPGHDGSHEPALGVELGRLCARLAEVERELRAERTEASVARSELGDARVESARLRTALRARAFDWDGKRWFCRDCSRSLYRDGSQTTVDDLEHEADCGIATVLDMRRDPTDEGVVVDQGRVR